jgi:glycosyltransferase involved in cell wall biosynthesis
MSVIVIAVYSHPEWYPPTLNAIHSLSERFDKIVLVCRNVLQGTWKYPENFSLHPSGKFTSIRASEKKYMLWKVRSFIQFAVLLLKQINREKPAVVLLYDPFPLYAYRLIRPFIKHAHLVWYHSHDIIEKKYHGRFSLGRQAAAKEQKSLAFADIFSLPAAERKQYFNLHVFKGEFFFLPNYPSLQRFAAFYRPKQLKPEYLQLLYQGSVTKGHGLENIIPLLGTSIAGRKITLTLIGPISPEYRSYLEQLATNLGVEPFLTFIAPVPYVELPAYTLKYDIGLAIHEPEGINFMTAATASNKIYEYAALGLPVLLYDNRNYRELLEQFRWAFFTDCTNASLMAAFSKMAAEYTHISIAAHNDFKATLNFEHKFSEALSWLESTGCISKDVKYAVIDDEFSK